MCATFCSVRKNWLKWRKVRNYKDTLHSHNVSSQLAEVIVMMETTLWTDEISGIDGMISRSQCNIQAYICPQWHVLCVQLTHDLFAIAKFLLFNFYIYLGRDSSQGKVVVLNRQDGKIKTPVDGRHCRRVGGWVNQDSLAEKNETCQSSRNENLPLILSERLFCATFASA